MSKPIHNQFTIWVAENQYEFGITMQRGVIVWADGSTHGFTNAGKRVKQVN